MQPGFVLAVEAFEWIGGRPCDAVGEPANLNAEPEVVTLLQILLNEDGDEHRIPQSQQVRATVRSFVDHRTSHYHQSFFSSSQ